MSMFSITSAGTVNKQSYEGKGLLPTTSGSSLFTLSGADLSKVSQGVGRKQLELLCGSGIEIRVGSSTLLPTGTKIGASNTWSLPIKLISHYSPFLKAASSWGSPEQHHKQIELPEDDPAVFGLFVEWMYYGSYDIGACSSFNPDAKCWVLGDKLLCNEFKNYSMSRLHACYTTKFFGRLVTHKDVQYAYDHTVPSSKLRQLYADFVIDHFGNDIQLPGTIGEWDTVLQNYSEIRLPLLEKFRLGSMGKRIKNLDEYFEIIEPHPEGSVQQNRMLGINKLDLSCLKTPGGSRQDNTEEASSLFRAKLTI